MRCRVILACCAAAGCLAADQAASWSRRGNVFAVRLRDGGAELELMSASAFRFERTWGGAPERRPPITGEAVQADVKDLGSRLEFSTRYLVVEMEKSGLRLRVKNGEGQVLSEMLGLRRERAGVAIEYRAGEKEKYYGLGLRTAVSLDLRGQRVRATTPLLISSAGYGEFHRAPGAYVYDLAQSQKGRRRVKIEGGDHLECFFYYGPAPKEILEEHVALGAPGAELRASDFGILEAGQVPKDVARLPGGGVASWEGLRDSIHALMHASFSGMLVAGFDLAPYLAAQGALAERGVQFGSVVPLVWASGAGGDRSGNGPAYGKAMELRRRLVPFLATYATEVRERGFPLARPLGMQFPSDQEAWKRTEEFMLGDELLIAPVCSAEVKQTVYLPQGIWTDLRSNQVYKGRQIIEVQAAPDELPIFVRNGMILPVAPVAAGEPTALHYFPKLAAEFFMHEEGLDDFSQFHAAPALEIVRLEIESLKAREYEWVVHHSGACRRVAQVDGTEYREAASSRALKPGAWFYDRATDNLHIRAQAKAGQDLIINLWLEVVWN